MIKPKGVGEKAQMPLYKQIPYLHGKLLHTSSTPHVYPNFRAAYLRTLKNILLDFKRMKSRRNYP